MNLDNENFFMSLGTIDQILGPRWPRVSVPQETVLTLNVLKIFSVGYVTCEFKGKIRLAYSMLIVINWKGILSKEADNRNLSTWLFIIDK